MLNGMLTVPVMLQCEARQAIMHTREERWTWTHWPRPGEKLPRPCTIPGCTYAHTDPAADFAAFAAQLLPLIADTSKGAARRLSEFRSKHSNSHGNIKPGEHTASPSSMLRPTTPVPLEAIV